MATSTTPQPDSLYTFNPDLGTFSSSHVENGEFIEDTDTCKALVTAIFKEQFGMDEGDAATPLGRLIEWLAVNFATAMRVNVQNANQIVLSAAAGQQLDAIALWFGLYRKPAVPTTVTAVLRGAQGTRIPAGSRARTSEGAVFVLQSDVTLDTANTLDGAVIYEGEGVFFAQEVGPIGCPADTLNTIDTPTLGWSMVYNPADGVIGRYDETDDALRARIEASRFHGNGFIYSMKNAIEAIDGVNSSMVVENDTGAGKTIHGIDDMSPHSIFVCVDGQEDAMQSVAEAVFATKPCGTGYHRRQGEQEADEYTVEDAYGNPYSVFIFKPESCPINLKFIIKNRAYTGSDIEGDVKNAVVEFANSHGYKIGEDVYASDITRAVEAAIPGIVVVSCGLTDGGTDQSESASYLALQEVAAYQKASFNGTFSFSYL